MDFVIFPDKTVVFDTKEKSQQCFPTEAEAVEFIREQELMTRINGGYDNE